MINTVFSVVTIIVGIVAVLGPIGTLAALIFAPAIVWPLVTKFITGFFECRICVLAVAIILACLASYWIGHHEAYTKGVDDTVAKIARADTALVNRALKARTKLKECQAEGERWDQTTGTCR